jgi:hypothetical protein
MKGTATMPTHGLSAGTRQCACGGWTRFIVCQYCGTTDPAFAAAGMVSITPLVVPARDADPHAIPPQTPAQSPSATSPLPVATQVPGVVAHDGDYAGLEAAASRMAEQRSAAPAAFSSAVPVAAVPEVLAAPVANPLTPPGTPAYPAAAPVPGAFAAPGSGTLPAPVPSHPAAPAPLAPATTAAFPVTPPAMEPPVAQSHDVTEAPAKPAGGRPTWLVPAVGVGVVAVAGAAYLLFGGSSSSTSSTGGAVPKGHPAAAAAAAGAGAVLARTAPAGATPIGAAVDRPVTTLIAGSPALTGRTAAGVTALTRYVVRVTGAIEQGNALTFATPAAASAFAAGPHVRGSGWQASIPKPGITLWDHAADDSHAVIVAKGDIAYVLTGLSKAEVPSLEAWATSIAAT